MSVEGEGGREYGLAEGQTVLTVSTEGGGGIGHKKRRRVYRGSSA